MKKKNEKLKITRSHSGHKRNPENDCDVPRLILTLISSRESCYIVDSLNLTLKRPETAPRRGLVDGNNLPSLGEEF